MKRLFDQHFLSHLLSLLALALLMPMGAWGQTLVFGERNEFQGLVEKSAETVNWSGRNNVNLPEVFILMEGSELMEPSADYLSYSTDNSYITLEDGKLVIPEDANYVASVTITATYNGPIPEATEGNGAQIHASGNYTITFTDDRLEFSGYGVQFSPSSATATYGQAFSEPSLEKGQMTDALFTYSSSTATVATVDESTGAVTIVGVGETTISAEFAGDGSVKPGSVSYTLTVSPQTVTVTGITASNKEYDGTTTATLSYSSAAIQIATGAPVSGVSVSSATGTFADANVGTDKTVTISDIRLSSTNYKVGSTGSQTSATASITAKEATLSWSNTSFTYDGQTHVPTATVSNLVSGDACTVTVSGAASAVGTHTATATALSNSNYSLPASATTSFTISAAAMTGVSATGYTGTYDGAAYGISVTAPEGATVTYGESANACTAAASPTLTNVGEKTVYYKVSKTGYTDVTGSQTVKITAKEATLSWSDTEFTYDGQTHVPTATVSNLVGQDACTVTVSGAASAVGTHTATATALSNSNYSLPASATTSFTISAAAMTGVSATGYTGTYDGAAHGISVTAPEGATVTYGESANACTAAASPTLTNVGEKTVYYKVSKTGYTDVTGSQTVKITAKEATLSWSDTEFTYDGQTHVPTATVSNLVGQDACTVTVSGGASAVGTHTATATALSNSNYSLPASATTSFTISAAAMTGVSATGYTGTYDGAAHGISVTAPEGATVTYGESANACTAAASPTLTNVGEKTVYYKVSKTGYTDVTGSQTVKITAKEATLSWSNLTFTYDGQTHVPTATVSNLVGQDACTVTVSGAASAVGTHTATATALSNSNYSLPASATTSFTISAAAMTGVSATGYTGTYDGAAHGISVTAPEGATVTYGESANACTADASPTYSEAGEYTVYYRVSMSGYDDFTGSAVVSIGKAAGWVAFSNGGTTITATIGEPFTPPTVSVTPNDATLYYTSSDPSVATVDANTGEVTLLKAGTTTITATFEGDNNYTGDYHSYNLTVVEQDLIIEPITKEVDYTMDGTDFLNADGTEKDLSNAVVNNILYTLKNQDSPEGDGYDPDLQSIVLNTEQSTDAVEKLIDAGVKPGTKEFAENFTGITFLVPAGEGFVIITSLELNGAILMAKVGSNAPVAISMSEMGDYSIEYKSDHETWVYLWNGGQGGIESIRTRGKKTVANIRVQNVAYKARSNAPDGILSVDVDDDDSDARWYNLRGQRIEKPKTKGLYIRNGQKVVVR